MDAYSTHIPYLAAAVVRAPAGDVVEFGAGFYSTTLLHHLCHATGRRLLTIESNDQWLRHLAFTQDRNHELRYVAGWKADLGLPPKFALAFIDNQPGSDRGPLVGRVRDMAAIVVAHDTENAGYGYEPEFAKYKYRKDYRQFFCHTSIVSNEIRVDLWP